MSKLLGITTTVIALVFAPALWADRTTVSPGWTMFSHQQDVEIGRQLANDLEGQHSLFTDRNSNVYLDSLGNQLAAHSPGDRFTYQFKIIDDRSFNAYALPGGLIYLNRGVIEAAQNEGQLAGILAHEIAHVALRHGSSEISNAYSDNGARRGVRGPAASTVLSDVNIGFGPGAAPLKYTREQERQADIAAVQILHDSGFDPRAMTQVFQQQNNTGRSSEFFAAHPTPLNFAAMVRTEMQNIGGLPTNLRNDNSNFESVKDVVLSASESRRGLRSAADRPSSTVPSTRMLTYSGGDIQFRYPSNWRVSEDVLAITIAPRDGMVNGSLAYGMQMGTYDWRGGRNFGQGLVPLGDRPFAADSLRQATDQFLDHLRRSNPNMRNVRSVGQTRVDGMPALISQTTNESPTGGLEADRIVTVLRPGGVLWYFIGVAPEREFNRYSAAFEDIVASARID